MGARFSLSPPTARLGKPKMEGLGAQVSGSGARSGGVYSPREAGLLISGRRAAKASSGLLNFGPRDLVPIPSQPSRLSGGCELAFRTKGSPAPVRLGESLGWGGMQGKRRQLTCREGSFSEPLGLTSGGPS